MEFAAKQDADPVAQRENLVQIRRDEEDGTPRVARGNQHLVHVFGRADVQPARGIDRDENALRGAHLARDDHLLLIPAGKHGGRYLSVRRDDPVLIELR